MNSWMRPLVLAALCAGCATNYVEVPSEMPHATITFQRNAEGVKAVNNEPFQGYVVMDNPQCDNTQNVATFSFDGQFLRKARFAGGKKQHFVMHSVPNQNIHGPWCWSYLGFDVVNGHDYVVMHESCAPKVYDVSDDNWKVVEGLDVINGFECPKK